MYVLGMVTPLLVISLFLDGKMPGVKLLRSELFAVNLFGQKYPILVSNLIASLTFFFTGWLILILTLQGKLAMGSLDGFTEMIQNAAMSVDIYIKDYWWLNIVFIILVILFLYFISKKVTKDNCCKK